MTGFVVRRLLSAVLVVVLTSMFVFVLFFVGMGDRAGDQLLREAQNGPLHTGQARLDRAQMGLDKSLVHNYREWVKGIFVGRDNVYMQGKLYDCPAPCLGISITTSEPVSTDLEAAIPRDRDAGGRRGGHLPHRRSPPRRAGGSLAGLLGRPADWSGSTLVVSAIPDYIIILMAWIYLSLKLSIFPNTGYYPITENPVKTVSYMMLPWLVLGHDQPHGLRAVHPRPDGGDPQRGLHAHRPGQGPVGATTGCSSTPARGDRAGDHDLRPRLRHAARGHDLHRADLQHQRHRLLGPAGPDRDRSTSTSSRPPCWSPPS